MVIKHIISNIHKHAESYEPLMSCVKRAGRGRGRDHLKELANMSDGADVHAPLALEVLNSWKSGNLDDSGISVLLLFLSEGIGFGVKVEKDVASGLTKARASSSFSRSSTWCTASLVLLLTATSTTSFFFFLCEWQTKQMRQESTMMTRSSPTQMAIQM